MLDFLSKILETVHLDKAERLTQFEDMRRKMTEEDVLDFYEDIERIDKIASYIMEITGVCLRTMSATTSDMIQAKFVSLFAKPLENPAKS